MAVLKNPRKQGCSTRERLLLRPSRTGLFTLNGASDRRDRPFDFTVLSFAGEQREKSTRFTRIAGLVTTRVAAECPRRALDTGATTPHDVAFKAHVKLAAEAKVQRDAAGQADYNNERARRMVEYQTRQPTFVMMLPFCGAFLTTAPTWLC
jgi:hypothetical protein